MGRDDPDRTLAASSFLEWMAGYIHGVEHGLFVYSVDAGVTQR